MQAQTTLTDIEAVTPTINEPKRKSVTAHVEPAIRDLVEQIVSERARWRTKAEFLGDAIIHYLYADDLPLAAEDVLDGYEYGGLDGTMPLSATVSGRTHSKIGVLIGHSQTPWNTRQEFLLCALANFIEQLDS